MEPDKAQKRVLNAMNGTQSIDCDVIQAVKTDSSRSKPQHLVSRLEAYKTTLPPRR
jgi:hypothetical protein